MPEGERVSMTAVPEARTLKAVLTGMPCSSFPSQSPERDCSFLKAAAECVPAQSGAAKDAASKRSSESLRRVTMPPGGERRRKWTSHNLERRDINVLTAEVEEWKHPCNEASVARNPERRESIWSIWGCDGRGCYGFTPRVSRMDRRCWRLFPDCLRRCQWT